MSAETLVSILSSWNWFRNTPRFSWNVLNWVLKIQLLSVFTFIFNEKSFENPNMSWLWRIGNFAAPCRPENFYIYSLMHKLSIYRSLKKAFVVITVTSLRGMGSLSSTRGAYNIRYADDANVPTITALHIRTTFFIMPEKRIFIEIRFLGALFLTSSSFSFWKCR